MEVAFPSLERWAHVRCVFYLQLASSVDSLRDPSGVFCLDGTHGTNDSEHILYTLIKISDSKKGIPVMMALVEKDHTTEHLEAALSWLKAQNPGWEPHTFMTDDDSKGECSDKARLSCFVVQISQWRLLPCAEFAAIKRVFPDAHPMLCLFHILRNVKQRVRQCLPDVVEKVCSLLCGLTRLKRDKRSRLRALVTLRKLYALLPEPDTQAGLDPRVLSAEKLMESWRGCDFALECFCCVDKMCFHRISEWMSNPVSWENWDSQPVPNTEGGVRAGTCFWLWCTVVL